MGSWSKNLVKIFTGIVAFFLFTAVVSAQIDPQDVPYCADGGKPGTVAESDQCFIYECDCNRFVNGKRGEAICMEQRSYTDDFGGTAYCKSPNAATGMDCSIAINKCAGAEVSELGDDAIPVDTSFTSSPIQCEEKLLQANTEDCDGQFKDFDGGQLVVVDLYQSSTYDPEKKECKTYTVPKEPTGKSCNTGLPPVGAECVEKVVDDSCSSKSCLPSGVYACQNVWQNSSCNKEIRPGKVTDESCSYVKSQNVGLEIIADFADKTKIEGSLDFHINSDVSGSGIEKGWANVMAVLVDGKRFSLNMGNIDPRNVNLTSVSMPFVSKLLTFNLYESGEVSKAVPFSVEYDDGSVRDGYVDIKFTGNGATGKTFLEMLTSFEKATVVNPYNRSERRTFTSNEILDFVKEIPAQTGLVSQSQELGIGLTTKYTGGSAVDGKIIIKLDQADTDSVRSFAEIAAVWIGGSRITLNPNNISQDNINFGQFVNLALEKVNLALVTNDNVSETVPVTIEYGGDVFSTRTGSLEFTFTPTVGNDNPQDLNEALTRVQSVTFSDPYTKAVLATLNRNELEAIVQNIASQYVIVNSPQQFYLRLPIGLINGTSTDVMATLNLEQYGGPVQKLTDVSAIVIKGYRVTLNPENIDSRNIQLMDLNQDLIRNILTFDPNSTSEVNLPVELEFRSGSPVRTASINFTLNDVVTTAAKVKDEVKYISVTNPLSGLVTTYDISVVNQGLSEVLELELPDNGQALEIPVLLISVNGNQVHKTIRIANDLDADGNFITAAAAAPAPVVTSPTETPVGAVAPVSDEELAEGKLQYLNIDGMDLNLTKTCEGLGAIDPYCLAIKDKRLIDMGGELLLIKDGKTQCRGFNVMYKGVDADNFTETVASRPTVYVSGQPLFGPKGVEIIKIPMNQAAVPGKLVFPDGSAVNFDVEFKWRVSGEWIGCRR